MTNRSVLPLAGLTVAVLPVTVLAGPLADLLHIAPPSPELWLPAAGIAAMATLWTEPLKAIQGELRPAATGDTSHPTGRAPHDG